MLTITLCILVLFFSSVYSIQIKLVDGFSSNEGTFLILHNSTWGIICDDGFNLRSASVACKEAGFGAAMEYYTGNHFNTPQIYPVLLDQLSCEGNEKSIADCKRDEFGKHDCQRSEASGARCTVIGQPRSSQKAWNYQRPKITANQISFVLDFQIRQSDSSGVLIAKIGNHTGGFCTDSFTLKEATVACRQLGKGFGKYIKSYLISDLVDEEVFSTSDILVVTSHCFGNETRLSQCSNVANVGVSKCKVTQKAVGVRCISDLPDLVPDPLAVQSSGYIVDVPLFYMTCAMEENCVAPAAYSIQTSDHNWMFRYRRLLKFSSIIANEGTADFLPLEETQKWQWHMCHMHYHSMAYFAHYEVFEVSGAHRILASGHKASFCLEDNDCRQGAKPRFKCSQNPLEKGSQGISPGCKDIYLHDLDCQWIDITELNPGKYKFRLIVNPQFRIAESSYFNNAVLCDLTYTSYSATFYNCISTHPHLT